MNFSGRYRGIISRFLIPSIGVHAAKCVKGGGEEVSESSFGMNIPVFKSTDVDEVARRIEMFLDEPTNGFVLGIEVLKECVENLEKAVTEYRISSASEYIESRDEKNILTITLANNGDVTISVE